MKNLTQKNNVKNIFYLLMFLVLAPIYSNAQNNPNNNSSEMCEHLKTIIQKDIKGKTSQDSAILFVASKDKNEAFKQAQNLVIKMNARLTEKKDAITTYVLPEENAKIQILQKEDECVYVILYLQVACENSPTKEIRYMRLKCYNDL